MPNPKEKKYYFVYLSEYVGLGIQMKCDISYNIPSF